MAGLASITLMDHVTPPNRRQAPRFDTLGRIVGHLIGTDLPVRVREISFGGFSIETMGPIAEGAVQRIRFTASDDWTVEIDARSVHSRPSCARDGSPRFATGFSFLAPHQSEAAVQRMLATITSVDVLRNPS
jgi:hypothetical protein